MGAHHDDGRDAVLSVSGSADGGATSDTHGSAGEEVLRRGRAVGV